MELFDGDGLVLDHLRQGDGADGHHRVVPDAVESGGAVNTFVGLVDKLDTTKGVGLVQYRFCFGWRESVRQDNRGPSGRVVFCPGDESDAAGKEDAAQKVRVQSTGTKPNPRSLGTLHEIVTLFVAAQDPAYPENELAQYIKTRELYDAVYRSMYRNARAAADAGGFYPLNAPKWVNDHAQRRFGCELKATGVVQAMHPDREFTTIKGPPTHPHPTAAITPTLTLPGPQT